MPTDIPPPGTTAPDKPKYGESCNGCGLCCLAGPCHIATDLLRASDDELCPALRFDETESIFRCSLMENPVSYYFGRPEGSEPKHDQADAYVASLIRAGLGAGVGCGMEDDQ